jgi:hypothetical protein
MKLAILICSKEGKDLAANAARKQIAYAYEIVMSTIAGQGIHAASTIP